MNSETTVKTTDNTSHDEDSMQRRTSFSSKNVNRDSFAEPEARPFRPTPLLKREKDAMSAPEERFSTEKIGGEGRGSMGSYM